MKAYRTETRGHYQGPGLKRRFRKKTQLYRVWCNLNARCRGSATNRPDLYEGLTVEWTSFAEFRAWALRTGFRKGMSPDRKDTSKGYAPGNVVWRPIHDNVMRALCEAGHAGEYEWRTDKREQEITDAS